MRIDIQSFAVNQALDDVLDRDDRHAQCVHLLQQLRITTGVGHDQITSRFGAWWGGEAERRRGTGRLVTGD